MERTSSWTAPQTPSAPEPPAARPPEPPSHPSRLQRASHRFLICVTWFCLRRLSSAEAAAEPCLATLQASTSSTSSQARGSAHRSSFHLFWKEVFPLGNPDLPGKPKLWFPGSPPGACDKVLLGHCSIPGRLVGASFVCVVEATEGLCGVTQPEQTISSGLSWRVRPGGPKPWVLQHILCLVTTQRL